MRTNFAVYGHFGSGMRGYALLLPEYAPEIKKAGNNLKGINYEQFNNSRRTGDHTWLKTQYGETVGKSWNHTESEAICEGCAVRSSRSRGEIKNTSTSIKK